MNKPFLCNNCKFIRNKALYGENNGSYPLILKFSQNTLNYTQNESKIQNFPTGKTLDFPLEIEVCDKYNHKLNTLDDGFIFVNMRIISENTTDVYMRLEGSSSQKIKNGSVFFENLIVFAKPLSVRL